MHAVCIHLRHVDLVDDLHESQPHLLQGQVCQVRQLGKLPRLGPCGVVTLSSILDIGKKFVIFYKFMIAVPIHAKGMKNFMSTR